MQSSEPTFAVPISIIRLRKYAEKHLAHLDERYREMLEAAPNAIVVVNQHGKIVLLNVQAEKQFGYSREELIGKMVTDIIPEGFAERLIAEGTLTAAEALPQQLGTGSDLTGQRKDGSRFPIELAVIFLNSDQGILVMAAVHDLSHFPQRYRGENDGLVEAGGGGPAHYRSSPDCGRYQSQNHRDSDGEVSSAKPNYVPAVERYPHPA
jgi:PAS domain S-box-containing protein